MSAPRYLTAPGQLDLAPCGTVTKFHPHRLAVKNWQGQWETNHSDHLGRKLTSRQMYEIAGSLRVYYIAQKEECNV